jgi:outer membrane protein assembly factor BamE (lipoprotein component of BamABCDE complex)
MKKVFAAGMVALLLAGCASSGNRALEQENQVTVQSKIQKGITTKQQVKAQFGDPMGVSFTDGGNEVWTYSLANVKLNGSTFIPFYGLFHNGSKAHVKQLVILFKNDIVEKYTMSESNTETKSGWAD